MTDEQKKALEDYVLLCEAGERLDRKAELLFMYRVTKKNERLDAIQATAADVHEESEQALDRVLKLFAE